MRLLAFAVLLAGCAVEGTPIRDWTLSAAAGPRDLAVTLPGKLSDLLPQRVVAYTLRAGASVAPGAPVTVGVDCFHGRLALTVDGAPVEDTGDSPVGEHRFTFVPTRASAALVLAATQDLGSLNGFGVAPWLTSGVVRGRGPIAAFNRYAYIIEASIAGTFGFLFGVMYLLDRRKRENGALALQALGAVAIPLKLVGALHPLGPAGEALLLNVCGNATAVGMIYFVHDAYELGPPHRAWLRSGVVLAATHVSMLVWYRAAQLLFPFQGLFTNAVLVYCVARFIALVRTRRADALLLLVGVFFAAAGVILEYVWLVTGRTPFGGVHTVAIGVLPVAIAQAIVMARHHAARERALERGADELRHQVAARSRELSAALAQLAKAPVAVEAERVLDRRYRVVRKLGAGGMGSVYEVERVADRQHLALKTLRGHADAAILARFAREAQIAAQVSHPNLLPVIDVGIADGALFLVMPLIGGGSLEDQRERFGDRQWARPLLLQIAVGVAALHERGIVHRDLKPGNLLIDDGVVKIADFGLASLYDDVADTAVFATGALADTAVDAVSLTRAGDVFGTPSYMAPELAAGVRGATPSSDVFALGVIACELLTGELPFEQPPVMASLHRQPIPPFELGGLDPAFARCLDLDPGQRPTAAELVELLQGASRARARS